MTRICITGGPRTGKTTMATQLVDWGHFVGCGRRDMDTLPIRHTDELIHLGWSEASQAASLWLDEPGPWIIEGVALARALRKWRERNPGKPPPVDRVIRLTTPHEQWTPGQRTMAKGEETVWCEIETWLWQHRIIAESAHPNRMSAPQVRARLDDEA